MSTFAAAIATSRCSSPIAPRCVRCSRLISDSTFPRSSTCRFRRSPSGADGCFTGSRNDGLDPPGATVYLDNFSAIHVGGLTIIREEERMKLYYHPVSTTSRPIVLFAAESSVPLDYQVVDLFSGEQYKPEYSAVNPSHQVPVLEDGDFRLTESSAILKYLAEKTRSPAYPSDLRKRARVNERMDWLNTGFYRD